MLCRHTHSWDEVIHTMHGRMTLRMAQYVDRVREFCGHEEKAALLRTRSVFGLQVAKQYFTYFGLAVDDFEIGAECHCGSNQTD